MYRKFVKNLSIFSTADWNLNLFCYIWPKKIELGILYKRRAVTKDVTPII